MARKRIGPHIEIVATPLFHLILVRVAPVIARVVADEKDASETTVVAVLAHVVGPVKRPAVTIARDPQLPHSTTVIARVFRNFDHGLNLPAVV